ncbi:MAG: thermonuclease family protein, partial [Candidatus Eisenbacteria bacterium]|nr:thermonuclease family protein [Candidatus Eisenbacteria bacterium]
MTAALLALLLSVPQPFEARVIAVHDGDTISVLQDARSLRLRLHGIDCPELGQPFGRAAKKETSALLFKRTVRVVPVGLDGYGRLVADVYLGSLLVNLELVRRGFAWHYTRYSRDAALAQAEREARSARRGLWADSVSYTHLRA